MKKYKWLSVMLCFALLCTGTAFAQTDLKQVLSKFDMKLYGRVKFDMNYDTASFAKFNDFLGAVKAGDDASNHSWNFNPRDTRFGFLVSRDDANWLSEGQIESDFYGSVDGNNYVPRIRLAFLKATNKDVNTSLLVGQDWIPVASLNPPTIDFGLMAEGGNLWERTPQITVRKKTPENLLFLLSAMKFKRKDVTDEDSMPWLLGKMGYDSGDKVAAISGGWKTGDVKTDAGEYGSVDRWLAALELKCRTGALEFMLEPWIGEGIDDEFKRPGLGVNTMLTEPEAMRGWGGFGSVSYDVSESVTLAGGYGIDQPEEDDLEGITLGDGQYTQNQYVFLNGWYKLTPALKFGLEGIYVGTDRPGDYREGVRLTTSAFLSF